jgi:uncharacterized protein (TIGR02145 family)
MKKNWRLLNYSLLISFILLALTYSCRKDDGNDQVKDFDDNVYNTVTIGTQVWMAENLKTTHLNDGTPIPNAVDSLEWNTSATEATPAYCWNNNDPNNKSVYGALYNFYSVHTGKLAPKGWHVATTADWHTLTTFLGGDSIAGGKMKETGTSHWLTPNTNATNTSSFTALPGGFRIGYTIFQDVGIDGVWWASNYSPYENPIARGLSTNHGIITTGYAYPSTGFSVRCIKD